jgi:hypothetical protein
MTCEPNIVKTEYKYIHFENYSNPKQKTGRWMCVNNNHGTWLGEVKWYPGWRQYCFNPASDTVFSKGCLEDINNFIQQLMDGRKR